jgi:hypothetical protein
MDHFVPAVARLLFANRKSSLLRVSDVVTREIVGHESAAISRLYTNIDTPTLQAAIAKLPDADVDEFPHGWKR